LSLTDCAALYGVSSLTSQAPISTIPIPTATDTAPVTDVTDTSAPTSSVYVYPTTTSPSGGFPTYTSSPNGTYSSPPVQVTGAANNLALGALPALALAAGAVLVL
jgi:hypothetical protein